MELTWLGHSTFRLDAEGKRVYIDPFLNGNPKCPEAEQTPDHVDVIAITHAHGDHLGKIRQRAIPPAKWASSASSSARVIARASSSSWCTCIHTVWYESINGDASHEVSPSSKRPSAESSALR